jgi:hypothetical protein
LTLLLLLLLTHVQVVEEAPARPASPFAGLFGAAKAPAPPAPAPAAVVAKKEPEKQPEVGDKQQLLLVLLQQAGIDFCGAALLLLPNELGVCAVVSCQNSFTAANQLDEA